MLITVRDRVFVYADDGEKKDEVFRGFVWTVNYQSSTRKLLSLTCYDNLIYFQESEDNRYFPAGKSSSSITAALCADWGVKQEYTYSSITHGKLALKGSLSDIILTQILEEVKKQTGKKFVVRSEKDVIKIMSAGQNSDVYEFKSKVNVIDTSSETTMDGMITKVVIMGEADKDGQSKVEATVGGDSATYGTLQKIQTKNSTTELADAKAEAEQTIKEKGKPAQTFEIEALDIPWVKLGDKVKVEAGNLLGEFIITGLTHSITDTEKTMTLELEMA